MNRAVQETTKSMTRRLSGLVLWLLCTLFSAGASANILDVTVTGGGTVFDSQGAINCTDTGGPNCQFDYGASDTPITLTANAPPGWFFNSWGGDCASSGSSATCPLVVIGDPTGTGAVQTVTAEFLPDTATVTVALTGSGAGNVQSDEPTPLIDCPGDCSELYSIDTNVTLTATATSPTSTFTGWSGGGCTGTAPCTIGVFFNVTVQANFENDADGDGVFDPNDLCPNTPPNTPVDANGCSQAQQDDDGDGVPNGSDLCPNTPQGETVDANGCGPSQLDDDSDGVSNAIDQCPNTPQGEQVDANGCSQTQLDDDGDGVSNDIDQCPNTPQGEQVDANGCSAGQLDEDGDGVGDDIDQCPRTPQGEQVDAVGCGPSQLDEDSDGVNNDLDQCPGTPEGEPVDANGCSEVQQFGNDLGDLPGLGTSEQRFGRRLDDLCPRLVAEGNAGRLNEAQQALREACSRLKNQGTTENQAADGLNEALVFQLPAMQMYMVELTQSQSRHLRNRMQTRRSGGGSGASVAGLNIRVGDETVPSAVVQSALDGLLGIGASEEPFADFGKLGLYVQGDIDTGDRDDDSDQRGYDFDTWNITLGGDYRFSENFFAGGSVSYGEVEVDHQDNRGETDVDQWALTLYAGWQITDGWFLDTMFSYGESDFDLERTISYVDVGGTFDSSHGGDTDGDQLFFGFNSGYTWNRGGWRFGPVASLAWLNGTIDEYTEQTISGSDAWNFIVEERDIESLRFSAGLQVDYIINTSWGVLIPGLRASYVMENEDEDENIKVRLANNPFAESELSSGQIVVDVEGRDDAFVDASFNLSAQFPMGVSGFFSYNFYSAYDNFSKDAYTIGVRWDKPF